MNLLREFYSKCADELLSCVPNKTLQDPTALLNATYLQGAPPWQVQRSHFLLFKHWSIRAYGS